MILSTSLTTLAIVVVPHVPAPAPPPASASPQQGCEYSLMINDDRYKPIYKCYTEAEYNKKVADDAASVAKQNRESQERFIAFLGWLAANWWKLVLWGIGGIVALFITIVAYDSIDRKRHPEKYDALGFRNDYWR